jgi:uncharacterized coiled-coil protein SlyX
MYNYSAMYLPLNKIIKEKESDFSPLQGKDFDDLVESIKRIGVRQPIIVYPADNGNDQYVIHSGYNRLRAVEKLGWSHIPCLVATDRIHAIDIRFDTDLYRRHLSEEEKAKYEELKKEQQREYLRNSVIPEIYTLYEEGIVDEDFLMTVANMPFERQSALLPVVDLRKDTQVSDTIAEYEQRIAELNEKIAELEANSANIEKLKKSINEKLKEKEREIIERYRDESADKIQQMIEDERARIHAEYKTDIEELSKNLRDMSRAKADAQKTIDILKEELQKYKSKEQEHKAITDKLKDELFVAKTTLQKAVDTETLSKRLDIIVQDALKTFELSVLLGVEMFVDDNLKKAMAEKAQQLQEIAIEMMQFFSNSEGSKKKK